MIISVTGGIASGKSTLTKQWATLGAQVIDLDLISREIVHVGEPALDLIAQRWGSGVLLADGSLNRQALADIVFNDDAERVALNNITHPAIFSRAYGRALASQAEIVVLDVPLLFGSLLVDVSVANVTVEAPVEVRVGRLVADRTMTDEHARARIASQESDEQRRLIADLIVTNSTDQESFIDTATQLWHSWLVPFNQALTTGQHQVSSPLDGVEAVNNLDLQKDRLAKHGVVVSVRDGHLCVTPSGQDLTKAGWLTNDDVLQYASPLHNLRATRC
ncbi:MAG: dephospho-CoA kinase [Actinomycetaceae bacterium]|nr:dephospho-CoA kinase [Actinomycetaceae bacterium]